MAPKRKSTDKPEPAKKGAKAEPAPKKAKAGALAVGDTVPLDIELLREDEAAVKLGDMVEDKGVVIFMYPRANTGGCTKQACGFRDRIEEFTSAGFDVFGMSFDKPKSQTSWKTKYDLPYHLLTDGEGELIKAFGALKAAKSVLRSHVIVGKGGKLLAVHNGVSPGDSFAEAAEFCTGNKQE